MTFLRDRSWRRFAGPNRLPRISNFSNFSPFEFKRKCFVATHQIPTGNQPRTIGPLQFRNNSFVPFHADGMLLYLSQSKTHFHRRSLNGPGGVGNETKRAALTRFGSLSSLSLLPNYSLHNPLYSCRNLTNKQTHPRTTLLPNGKHMCPERFYYTTHTGHFS